MDRGAVVHIDLGGAQLLTDYTIEKSAFISISLFCRRLPANFETFSPVVASMTVMRKRFAGLVDKDLCKPTKCGHECARVCPINRKGEECIKIAEFAEIVEPLCIGCGLCVRACPFKALTVVNYPSALETERPIHRYGVNEFELFRLPVPMKGVTGIVGPNGVGKSTALKILSGRLSPNLGLVHGQDLEEKIRKGGGIWKELITMHRGTEAQSYLELLAAGEIRAVLKPQDVTALRHLPDFGKTVADIAIDDGLIDRFHLRPVLERSLEKLSGGEMQRVAVAAALSKDADFYYFDEPMSFLDVRQRLNVAKAIRELAGRGKHIIVVEHDLATLDYLADNVYIFYGKPGVFGIVSKPYTVKRGINVFLDGYIPEDNVRIREATIFAVPGEEKKKARDVLVSVAGLRKAFSGFEVRVDAGEIYRDEVLGIFGANGLGKTTFAKILAGVEEPDEGTVSKKITISYKPQDISRPGEFRGTVSDILEGVGQDLVTALQLGDLLLKNVKDLSGGELQRVAIAACLGKDADYYLLDEPSAFLDVDQRLAVAKLLKEKNNVAVIDHDLLFLSYVADRAMLFTGEPGRQGRAEFLPLKEGMNRFLSQPEISITFRADPENRRPRANKPGSVVDREQREKGEFFSL